MDRVKIHNSSHIAEIGYDESAKVLEVLFQDGGTYWYFDVPEKIAEGLFRPPTGSVGEYFHARIMRRYDHARV